MRFDRSWLPGIAAVIVLVIAARQIPPRPTLAHAALLLAGGGWLLWTAWNIWRNPTGGAQFGSGGKRVQYWRGQRIELEPAPRPARRSTPPTNQLLIAAFYAATGAMSLALGLLSALGGLR